MGYAKEKVGKALIFQLLIIEISITMQKNIIIWC